MGEGFFDIERELEEFKKRLKEESIKELEDRIEHHADMIYNKLQPKLSELEKKIEHILERIDGNPEKGINSYWEMINNALRAFDYRAREFMKWTDKFEFQKFWREEQQYEERIELLEAENKKLRHKLQSLTQGLLKDNNDMRTRFRDRIKTLEKDQENIESVLLEILNIHKDPSPVGDIPNEYRILYEKLKEGAGGNPKLSIKEAIKVHRKGVAKIDKEIEEDVNEKYKGMPPQWFEIRQAQPMQEPTTDVSIDNDGKVRNPAAYYLGWSEAIDEFMKSINNIIKDIEYENKNGTWNEDIENNTEEKRFWEGYRYGILSILGDYLIPMKEEWQGKEE